MSKTFDRAARILELRQMLEGFTMDDVKKMNPIERAQVFTATAELAALEGRDPRAVDGLHR